MHLMNMSKINVTITYYVIYFWMKQQLEKHNFKFRQCNVSLSPHLVARKGYDKMYFVTYLRNESSARSYISLGVMVY